MNKYLLSFAFLFVFSCNYCVSQNAEDSVRTLQLENISDEEDPFEDDDDFSGSMFGNMGNLYTEMVESMHNASLDFYSNPEKLMKLAEIQKSYYNALVSVGFTKDQAMQILISSPLGVSLMK